MIAIGKIHTGSCLEHMRQMPDGFVQAVITSPPFYGLRCYQTEPQIWDADENCQHVWGKTIAYVKQDTRTMEEKAAQGASVGSSVSFNNDNTQGNSGAFCQRCNAWKGELGLEPSFQLYIKHLIQIFAEVKRILKPDGCVFVNLGDSFATHAGGIVKDPMRLSTLAGTKSQMEGRIASAIGQYKKGGYLPEKCLMNIPHRFFIAMTDELQYIQRNNINWWKRACMPSSAKDRFTVDFESIGFFVKEPRYKFNQQLEPYTQPLDRWGGENLVATQSEGWHTGTGQQIYRDRNMRPNPEGRNARTTWDIGYEPTTDEHFAAYPTELVGKMILAATDENDIVYDPFGGTASTALAAHRLGRQWICSELQPKYVALANRRMERYLAQHTLF